MPLEEATMSQGISSDPDISVEEKEQVFAALDRGDLIRLLAKIDSGELEPDVLERMLEKYSKKHWFKRFLTSLFHR